MRHLFHRSRLSLVLGGLLLLAPVHAQLFQDVPLEDADCIAIEDIAVNQLMEGFPDGNFHPELPARHAEGLMVMARLLNISLKGFMILPGTPVENPKLANIPASHWLYPAACFLAQNGMLNETLYRQVRSPEPMTRGTFLAGISCLLHGGVSQNQESAIRDFAERALLPDEWKAQPNAPITRREMARFLDRTLFHLTQHAMTEGTVTGFETGADGSRWVRLETPIGEARLCMPTRGILVEGSDNGVIREGMRIRTISDAVSRAHGAPYYRVREVQVIKTGQVAEKG